MFVPWGVLNERLVITIVIHIGTNYSNTTFLLLFSNATCFDQKWPSDVRPHNIKNHGQVFLLRDFSNITNKNILP
jgi:hypothetical protein